MILRHGISRPKALASIRDIPCRELVVGGASSQSESEVSTSWAGLSVVSTYEDARYAGRTGCRRGVELAEGVSEKSRRKKSVFLVECGAQGVKGTLGRQEARSSNS